MEAFSTCMNCKDMYLKDISRYGSHPNRYIKSFHWYFRKSQNEKNKILSLYYKLMYKLTIQKRGLEIDYRTVVGKGLYLGHAYNITINPLAILGDNINIHKGVTIGQENRGQRQGTPVLGNKVWIGVNATIVGKVTIGDDVLIAPNSYVNCDVPSHSIVFGNPCVIKHRENATEGYINNIV